MNSNIGSYAKYNEFIEEVQQKAKMSTSEQAVRSVRAALTTLAERIPAREAHHLASRLPKEIGIYLTTAETQLPMRLTVREFLLQVSSRADVSLPKSVNHSRVVFNVLRQTISPDEFDQVLKLLPSEFDEIFRSDAQAAASAKKRAKPSVKAKKSRK